MTPASWITILLSCSPPAATQSSFSPFSLLGSLFSSGPNWSQSRPRPDTRQPVARQSRQPPPGGLHFRAKIPLGHKFSASQQVPSVVRFNDPSLRSLSAPPPPPPGGPPGQGVRHTVLRITAPSNYSLLTTTPTPTTPPVASSSERPWETTTHITTRSEEESEHLTLSAEDETTLTYDDENVHIIYPENSVIQSRSKSSEAEFYSDGGTEQPTTDNLFALSETPFSSDSAPPATNFSQYKSAINDSEQKDSSEDKSILVSSIEISQPLGPESTDSGNPYYAPEEFTYNQDPLEVPSIEADIEALQPLESLDTNQILESQFSIRPRGERRVEAVFQERSDAGKSVDFDRILSERLARTTGSTGTVKLVNTIEYQAGDYKGSSPPEISNSYRSGLVGGGSFSPVTKNMNSLAALVDCGAGTEAGFCSMSSSYPMEKVDSLMYSCQQVLQAWQASLPDDIDLLGDNSPSVITSEKDSARPWSWKVYAYKKKQVCQSELYFLQPGFARDTKGDWQIIVQTESIKQRVAVDMCHAPDLPCPGMADCGKKSRCVQRYSYQMLLSLSTSTSSPDPEATVCPSIRAFRFPSGCVCHAEVVSGGEGGQPSDHHHHTF